MATITGKVNSLTAYNTSFGEMYSLTVNGERIGVGKYPPRDIKEGDFVTVEYEVKGQYKNATKGGVRKEAAPSEEVKKEAAAAAKTHVAAGDARQTVISRQAALNTALTYVNFLTANAAIAFPASVKAGDKLDLLDQFFLETAARFYKLSTGDEWVIDGSKAATLGTKKQAPKQAVTAPADDSGTDEYPDEIE